MSEVTPTHHDLRKKVASGEISVYKDVLQRLTGPSRVPVPEHVPLPREITEDERAAIKALPEVFGSVTPTERRALTKDEASALLDERGVLKTVEDLISDRKAAIRTAVLNHHDVLTESEREDTSEIPREKDGHYAVKRRVHVGGQDFSVEPRAGSATLDPEALRALAEDPEVEDFTHDDYLAMTSPTRVFDEHKAMLLIKKRPDLLDHLAALVEPGTPSVSVQPRKCKGEH